MTKYKRKMGDFLAIPINDEFFAFGRIMNDSSISVFPFISKEIVKIKYLKSLLEQQENKFCPGVFGIGKNWKYIGNVPFNNIDESWPPPQYSRDIVDHKKYQIYFKGVHTNASSSEIDGLEEMQMYKPQQVVDEIIKRSADWNKTNKKDIHNFIDPL